MEGRIFDGLRLRAVRQSSGVRMVDLARAADCSYGHLRMAEKGKRQLSTELAYRIARTLTDLTGRTVGIDEFSDPAPTVRKEAA